VTPASSPAPPPPPALCPESPLASPLTSALLLRRSSSLQLETVWGDWYFSSQDSWGEVDTVVGAGC